MAPNDLKQMVYLSLGYDSITWWLHERITNYDRSPFITQPLPNVTHAAIDRHCIHPHLQSFLPSHSLFLYLLFI